jgi:hypothetical protein
LPTVLVLRNLSSLRIRADETAGLHAWTPLRVS